MTERAKTGDNSREVGAAEPGQQPELPATTRRVFLQRAAAATAGLLIGCGGAAAPASLFDGGVDGNAGADRVLPGPDAALPDGGSDGDTAPPPDAPVAPPVPPEETPLSHGFGLGVAAGDATPTTALLWTRYTDARPLHFAVWEVEGDSYLREVASGPASPADGGYVHALASELSPGAAHRYAFFELGDDGQTRTARSPIGRFRAALPDEMLAPLVLGAVSCTHNDRGPFRVLERAAERSDLAAFLLVGDTAYNDGATTLAEYRSGWQGNLGTLAYRSLLGSTSVVATWDDHEVDNNWNPEDLPPGQLEIARSAFFEHLPVSRQEGAPERVWRSLRWGRTAEIFVLDSRAERKPSTRGATDEYLSRAQLDWLKRGLAKSRAVFKLVVNSVPISSFPSLFDLAQEDRWEGYPGQRQELLSHIEELGLRGILWVSGDFHLGSIQKVSTEGPGQSQVEVLAGPGGQNANPGRFLLREPQFEFVTGDNNYVALHLDPMTSQIRIVFHGEKNEILTDRTYTV